MEVKIVEQYYVYRHVNRTNGKQYIGITKQNPAQRWGRNGVNYRECSHFWSAIQKYGWDMFDHEIIASGLSKEDACDMEMQLISLYKTQDREYGYNTLEGGTAPCMPPETRQKMSVAMMGNTNGAGHPCTEEKKQKISAAQKGRHLTEEHKQKLSMAKRGQPHPSPSLETRQKISRSHAKMPVYCMETNTVYESIQECARQLGVYATLVCQCCKNKLPSTGGYHFQYYSNNNTLNA